MSEHYSCTDVRALPKHACQHFTHVTVFSVCVQSLSCVLFMAPHVSLSIQSIQSLFPHMPKQPQPKVRSALLSSGPKDRFYDRFEPGRLG
eukprot:1138569-Pelagomonas_calceolata.AAC.6